MKHSTKRMKHLTESAEGQGRGQGVTPFIIDHQLDPRIQPGLFFIMAQNFMYIMGEAVMFCQ